MSSEQLTEELSHQRTTNEVASTETVENKPEAAPQAFNSNSLNRKMAQSGPSLAQALGSNSNSLRRKMAQGASAGPATSLKRSPLGTAADLGGPLTVSEEERKNAFGALGTANLFDTSDSFARPANYGIAKNAPALAPYTAADAAPLKGLMDQISPAPQPQNPTVTNTTTVTAAQGKNPYSFSKKATFGAQGLQFQDYNPAPIDSVGVTNTTNVAGTIPGLPGSNFKLTGTLNLAGANLSDEVKRQLSLGATIVGDITLFQLESAGAITGDVDPKTKQPKQLGTYQIKIVGPTGHFEISDTETFTNPDPAKNEHSVSHTSTSSSKGSYNLLHLTGSAHYDPTGSLLDVDLNVGEGGKITGTAHAIAAHLETKGDITGAPAKPGEKPQVLGGYSGNVTVGDVTATMPATGPASLSGNLLNAAGAFHYDPTGTKASGNINVPVNGPTTGQFDATAFQFGGKGNITEAGAKPGEQTTVGGYSWGVTGPDIHATYNSDKGANVTGNLLHAQGAANYTPTGSAISASANVGLNGTTTAQADVTTFHTKGSGQFDGTNGKYNYDVTGPTAHFLYNSNSGATLNYSIVQASGDLSYSPTGTKVAASLTIGKDFATTGKMTLTALDKTFTLYGNPQGLHLDGEVKVVQTTATLTPNGLAVDFNPLEIGLTLKDKNNTYGTLTADPFQGKVQLNVGISF